MVIIDLFLLKPLNPTVDRELIASLQARTFFYKFTSYVKDIKDLFDWVEHLPSLAWLLPTPDSGDGETQSVDSESVGSA
jgi:hypothetical protein